MRIAVLNGSPKGGNSVTLQYARYIANHFPGHEWIEREVSSNIDTLEKERETFNGLIGDIRASDAVLWSFPLFFFLVPGQMKRFIELVFERSAQEAFRGKYAAVLTTSVHFYDHTAHNYMNAICDDLGMEYFGGFSAGMMDLQSANQRLNLLRFGERFVHAALSGAPTLRNYDPVRAEVPDYVPSGITERAKSLGKRITLLTDAAGGSGNLTRMTDVFVKWMPYPVEVININAIDIEGGCLACLKCGYDNQCMHHDGYRNVFEEKVKPAEGIVFAGSIRDRFLSARWKTFLDRSFYNGHVPVLREKQVAYIVSGRLRENRNIREILEAYADIERAHTVGIATDEYDTSEEITARIRMLADDMAWSLEKNYLPPQSFRGKGGHLLLRDLIYGELRFPFAADHRYYKKHGLYDFPQKDIKRRAAANFMSLLYRLPGPRKNIQENMAKYIVQPLRKHVETGDWNIPIREDTGTQA
jgi:multimeric flavodoxin WrbA